MKVIVASAALALLPALTLADDLEKRALSCSTVFQAGNKIAAGVKLATATRTVGGKTVTKTIKAKKTVFVTPTVKRVLSGSTVVTDKITKTAQGKPTTITVTGSSTSTIATQPGFTNAAGAVPKTNTNVIGNKNAKHVKHAAHHSKRAPDAVPEPAAPKKADAGAALSVICTATANGAVTVTATVAQKPYITKYAKAVTKVTDRRKTIHKQKIVATTTIRPKKIVELPRATHYAGCSADNLLSWTWGLGSGSSNSSSFGNGTFGGNGTSSGQVGISSVILVSGTTVKTSDTSTATQCCIRCQTTPGCVGSQWRSGVCSIHVRPAQFGTCSKNQAVFTVGSFFADPKNFLDTDEGYTLSNGRCGGTWKFGGLTL